MSENARSGIGDDLRQAFVVAKNEIRKFVSGKKFYLLLALALLTLVIIASLPYLLGSSILSDTMGNCMSVVNLGVILSATLLASTSIVSEFEERTALILFTKPIKKSSIYVGKYLACVVVTASIMVIYYVISVIMSQFIAGSIPSGVLTSFGVGLCHIFATVGVAMLISSISGKSSTSSIMTFLILAFILSMVGTLLVMYGVDTWWILDNCAQFISSAIGGVAADGLIRAVACMIVWGLVPGIAGYYLFSKRDL